MEEERLERDLQAIEAEKKEYLKSNPDESLEEENSDEESDEESEEEIEVDVETEEMDFSLTEGEIDEWINELTKLKEDKEFILLEVDEENTLKINYQEDSDDEDDEENFEEEMGEEEK